MLRRSLIPHAPIETLTVREHFACQILTGLIVRESPGTPEDWAETAVWYADALIAELNSADLDEQSS